MNKTDRPCKIDAEAIELSSICGVDPVVIRQIWNAKPEEMLEEKPEDEHSSALASAEQAKVKGGYNKYTGW